MQNLPLNTALNVQPKVHIRAGFSSELTWSMVHGRFAVVNAAEHWAK